MMDLNILWFILITVLFTGFFFLEGFDYGVGGILPFLSSDEEERGEVLRTITPVWDGNEVWMITAGGALFALLGWRHLLRQHRACRPLGRRRHESHRRHPDQREDDLHRRFL